MASYGTIEPSVALLSESSLDEFMSCKHPEEKYQNLVLFGGAEGLAAKLGSDVDKGLSDEERRLDGYAARAARYGRNMYPARRIPTLWELWWDAFQDEMIIILTIAAFVSIIVSLIFPPEGESRATVWIEGAAILSAVVIVTVVTALNNYSQERQFQVLSLKQDERPIRVVRGGKKLEVIMTELLVGDVIMLEQGDPVPTDGIFISGHSCACEESNMTGEAEPQNKNRKKCFMLSGCRVVHGSCKMLATAVGMRSEWGKVLSEMDVEREDTPLQMKLGGLARNIGFLGVGVAVLVFFVLLVYWAIDTYHIVKDPLVAWHWTSIFEIIKFFIISITIVVVAVPEGLPLAVTIALAYSTKKMMTDNNLVRHLAACETMGGVTQICSDKTGTLTQNRMTVTQGWISGSSFQDMPSALDYNVQSLLVNAIARNSTGDLKPPERPGDKVGYSGNPTECAMLAWINRFPGVDYDRLRNDGPPIVKMFPFSSARKRMSVVVRLDGSSGFRMFCKGASEIILGRCTSQLASDGSLRPLNADQKQQLIEVIERMASNGLRTLAIAYRDFPVFDVADENEEDDEPPEDNLVLIALTGIEDPVRPEVPGAVEQCMTAGVTVRMVTGDNVLTAKHIARQCRILTDDGIALEGPQFADMSDEEVYKVLPRLQVLARSAPSDKTRLVRCLRHFHELVAVTGDGTNDGPALKAAHIGCAMGSGTQVAIEASDIVILDDNFYSIVKAIMWGRSIFDNIRKFLQFQLTVNVGALAVAFLCAALNLGTPLYAIQLLWVNLIMDSIGALALATEPPSADVLQRPPINAAHPKTWLVNPNMMKNIGGQALYQVIILMLGVYLLPYVPNLSKGPNGEWTTVIMSSTEHYTIIFNTFVYCQIFNEINARKVDGTINVFSGILLNPLFIGIILFEAILQAMLVEVPYLNDIFHCTHLSWREWLLCLGVGAFSLVIGVGLNLLTPFFPQDRLLTAEDYEGLDTQSEDSDEELKERQPLLAK